MANYSWQHGVFLGISRGLAFFGFDSTTSGGGMAPDTQQSYKYACERWSCWCMVWDTDFTSAPVSLILQFLAELFDEDKAYRTINVYRSAISASHSGFDGFLAGQHLQMRILLRGMQLSHPLLPHYQTTWDISFVLHLFKS